MAYMYPVVTVQCPKTTKHPLQISEVVLDPVLTGAWHFTPRCVASRYMRYAFVWTMSEPIIRRASEVQVTRYFSAHIVKPVSSIATYLNCRASQYYMWCAYFVVVIPDALLEQWQIISLFDAFCLINISFDSVCKSILLPAAFSGAILIAIKVTSLDIFLFYLAFFIISASRWIQSFSNSSS